MPTSSEPADRRDPAVDSDRETRDVIRALLSALEAPGSIDPGHAAHLRAQLQALLDASEAAHPPHRD